MQEKLTRFQIEGKIHRAIWRYYEGKTKTSVVPRPFPQLVMWHPANESWEDTPEARTRGAIQQLMGLVKGAYDFTLMWPGVPGKGIIEVKAPGGRIDAAQDKFKHRILATGAKEAVVFSVAEWRDTLIGWGLKCHNTAVTEPDLRTDDEKKRDAFAMFAPLPD